MATQSVRVEFMCDKDTLKFTHKIPRSLFNSNPNAAQLDPQYMNNFVAAVKPIVAQHYRAALEASAPNCGICGSPTTQALITPMSWLHVSSDPFINVIANAACNKPECDMKIRQHVQDLMADMNRAQSKLPGEVEFEIPKNTNEIIPCRVCKKVEKTLKCGRCGVVAYCGKSHQQEDWPLHKEICKKVARA